MRKTIITAALSAIFLTLACSAQADDGKGYVTVEKTSDGYQLLRDGKPYYVKGCGGQTHLDLAAGYGANSTRTWGDEDAVTVLNKAKSLGMTATIGVWLDHGNGSYKNEGYKSKMRSTVQNLVSKIKDNPALLIYALGNETNSGADTPEAWTFINELAEIVHKGDPNHPTMTVLAGSDRRTINNVAKYAPAINILGLNTYAGISGAPQDAESSNFKGPYMITEYGVRGHWEVGNTSWGAPLEPSSDEKQKTYKDSYDIIYSHRAKCVGSYVFLWGQKQERTPTWYGMFIEDKPSIGFNGEAISTVDAMAAAWSGKRPANLGPSISAVYVNGSAPKNLTLSAGDKVDIAVDASDPDKDKLSFKWEVLAEATQLGSGGSFEGRPKPVPAIADGAKPGTAVLTAPAKGNYRFFVYAFDGKGKVATLNVPFKVK